MKSFSFLLILVVIVIYFSCSGSDDESDRMQDNQLMGSNCTQPNLKIDVNINRKFCGNDDCLFQFAGYWWWTNYEFKNASEYFYNQGQNWSPRNPVFQADGIHLRVRKDDLGEGKLRWMASEVVAVFENDKRTLFKTGYGTYLVSVKVLTADSWDKLDRNVVFGAFTYQRDKSGNMNNPYLELDLAEISRWGAPPCSNLLDQRLCSGNAQFAVQLWDSDQDNVHRYSISTGVKEITLVMKWTKGNTPVTFSQYNGLYNLENLPSSPANSWTTDSDQNKFIPFDQCQLFHMNLWMGNYKEKGQDNDHPGPSNGQDQEVVVTNFQYKPL
ncbi:MAG: hypothetical protein HGGPFJEG_02032 [Ignavibacteria bacterium]|nr:hypothetical protein [Ignavibacteria bacterium]